MKHVVCFKEVAIFIHNIQFNRELTPEEVAAVNREISSIDTTSDWTEALIKAGVSDAVVEQDVNGVYHGGSFTERGDYIDKEELDVTVIE